MLNKLSLDELAWLIKTVYVAAVEDDCAEGTGVFNKLMNTLEVKE